MLRNRTQAPTVNTVDTLFTQSTCSSQVGHQYCWAVQCCHLSACMYACLFADDSVLFPSEHKFLAHRAHIDQHYHRQASDRKRHCQRVLFHRSPIAIVLSTSVRAWVLPSSSSSSEVHTTHRSNVQMEKTALSSTDSRKQSVQSAVVSFFLSHLFW